MKIKKLISELKKYKSNTELDFVIYSGNEDTDCDDLPLKYIGGIDTSLIDYEKPRLTLAFKSPNLKYSYNKSWSLKK